MSHGSWRRSIFPFTLFDNDDGKMHHRLVADETWYLRNEFRASRCVGVNLPFFYGVACWHFARTRFGSHNALAYRCYEYCMQKRILSLRYLDTLLFVYIVVVFFFVAVFILDRQYYFCYFSHFIKHCHFSAFNFYFARESCSRPVIGIIHAKLWKRISFIP